MTQRAEVQELRDKFEHNEISNCEVWELFYRGKITRYEALWILR